MVNWTAGSERHLHLKGSLDNAPDDLDSLCEFLGEGRRVFLNEMCAVLEPVLNKWLKAECSKNPDALKAVAYDINDRLRKLGLTMLSPEHAPAYFVVDHQEDANSKKRVRIVSKSRSGVEVKLPVSADISKIILAPYPERSEPGGSHASHLRLRARAAEQEGNAQSSTIK